MARDVLEHQFVDRAGGLWSIELDVGLARSIKTATGVDFVNFATSKAAQKIHTDDETFVRVLWLLIEEQAAAAGVDEEAFARRLNGDVLGAAMLATLAGVVNFSPPARRETMRAIMAKTAEVQATAGAKMISRLNAPEMSRAIAAAMDAALKNPPPITGD